MTVETPTEDSSSERCVPLARPIGARRVGPAPCPHPLLLAEQSPRSAGWDIAILVLLCAGIEATMRLVARYCIGADESTDARAPLLALTLVRGLLLIGALSAVLGSRRQTAASIGLCSERWWRTGLFGMVATVGAYAALIGTVGAMYVVCRPAFDALQRNPEKILSSIPRLHPLVLCAVALFVGFYEELIFRGFLLTRLRRATGSSAAAVALSAALFGVLHAGGQEVVAAIPLFAIGVVWAVLTLWRRSVVPAIIGHAMFDLCQLMGLYFFQPDWK